MKNKIIFYAAAIPLWALIVFMWREAFISNMRPHYLIACGLSLGVNALLHAWGVVIVQKSTDTQEVKSKLILLGVPGFDGILVTLMGLGYVWFYFS